MSGNNRYSIPHGIDYDTVVRLDVFCVNASNSYLPLARVGYSGSTFNESFSGYAYIDPDNINITIGSSSVYSGAIVIVEYTKS
ncbi:MAG TPA: hypothetical protein OIM20_07640 [Eggerthellaceae bacterium]|nr:hypothetical protein [Eggerthellaceae bacterium]